MLLFLFSVVVFILIQAPPGDFLDSYIATLASMDGVATPTWFSLPIIRHP